MSDIKNCQILLVVRPEGEPKPSDFQLVESDIPTPSAGEVLCRTIYLSLDPYMRGRMTKAKSYANPVELGTVMDGGCVGEVIASFPPLCPDSRMRHHRHCQYHRVSVWSQPGALFASPDPHETSQLSRLYCLGF